MIDETQSPSESPNEYLLIQRLKEKMVSYRTKIGLDEYQKWHDGVKDLIVSSIPNGKRERCTLWSAFIGGSRQGDFFDFEGEFSIKKMIENLPI